MIGYLTNEMLCAYLLFIKPPLMKNNVLRFCVLVIAFFFIHPNTNNAWNAKGHMLIATITYDNMNDSVKNYYTNLLQHHPAYAQWQTEFKGLKDIPEGAFLFMKASVWPDVIRKSGSKDDHPKWHYVTYKIDFEKGHEPKVQNKDENVLTAIQLCEDSLKSKTTSVARKAVFLSWLIHLVGDIHQPLHCGSLFNTMYPEGDKGGNDVWIHFANDHDTSRLHGYWDDLSGKGTPYLEIQKTAIRLLHNSKSVAAASKINKPTDWAKESFDLAIAAAYDNGAVAKLPGIKDRKTAPILPNEKKYSKRAHQIGTRRMLLAALRLGNAL
jgi:hypothetical protein